MAARSCPDISRASRSPCRTSTRPSAVIRSAKCRTRTLLELEQNACPSAGACGAQFTANTMATVSEAIGLALPYSAGAPAPYEMRDRFCMLAGEMIMELIVKNIRPARHRHPQGAGKCRRRRVGHRRFHQCCAASAGDRARMRYRVHAVRRRRNLQKDTLYRRFETGWPLCRQGYVRSWRRADSDEDHARPRLSARRLPDRHRPHDCRKSGKREVRIRTRTWCARPTSRCSRPAASSA